MQNSLIKIVADTFHNTVSAITCLAVFTMLLILLNSCEKITGSKMPDIPESDSIDVTGDSQFDFVIEYSTLATTDVPPSHQSITGAIRPMGNNQVLYRKHKGYLFLEANDTIFRQRNLDADWSDYAASVIGINGSRDKWDRNWTIVSEQHADYYLGIKIKEPQEKIGWILLDLNTESGKISIRKTDLSTADTLIIKHQ